ncbi:MAG: OmpA family protein [Bacteroidales bacterium]|nr:OmpA family protein [Bacteroidales bacterium]
MKIIGYLIIFLMQLSFLSAQNIPLLFDENFDDNAFGWDISDNDDATAEISNGYFFINNKGINTGYRFWTQFNIDPAQDFIVECKIRQVFGNPDDAYGLFIVSDGIENNYNFEIKSDGHFRTSIQTDGQYDVDNWSINSNIKQKGEYNILKIKKTNGYLYYYVNDRLLNAQSFSGAMGLDFGFVLRSRSKVQVDYLKIYGNKPQINLVDDPITNPKENLGAGVNTTYSELIPIIAPDGKNFYFVRDDYPGNIGSDKDHNDIWVSAFDGTNWLTARNIDRPLNNSGHNFVIAVTPDNNTLVLNGTYTAFGDESGNGISLSTRNNDGSWSIPKTVEIDNFYNDDLYQNFTVSTDLQVIIMAIERADDTYGQSDLYVSFRKSDGTYTEPKNLGPKINTTGEEGTPFLAADGRTLYFYSDGHNGYGDADIFVSKRVGTSWTEWTEPLNLGPNINTPQWDAYFTLDASGEYAYLVSSSNAIGEEDIFRVKIQEELQPDPVVLIYGKVYDQNTNLPLASQITYDDLTTNLHVDVANSSGTTGEYKIILPYGTKYGFFAKKDGYMALSDNIDLTNIEEYTEIERNLYLIPIQINQQIILNNVFFERGRADIKSSSYPELDRFVQTLKLNPEIEIEVQGYTNNIGDRQALIDLSEQRAIAVKNYLISKGISESRITTKGYGPDNPIADNSTPDGRTKNQRVEFKITNL